MGLLSVYACVIARMFLKADDFPPTKACGRIDEIGGFTIAPMLNWPGSLKQNELFPRRLRACVYFCGGDLGGSYTLRRNSNATLSSFLIRSSPLISLFTEK